MFNLSSSYHVLHIFVFALQTNQGIKNLLAQKASEVATADPDYSIRDLYNAIAQGKYPSWTLNIQVMTFEEAEKFRWNPFDLTKVNTAVQWYSSCLDCVVDIIIILVVWESILLC
jgi:catalase